MDIGSLVGYVDLETGPMEKALDKVGDFLKEHVSGWKGVLVGGGLAAATAFSGSLIGAMDLEPGRDKIAASLGLTEKQAKIAGDVAGKVYSDAWGDSAEDVNEAVEAIMSSIKGMRNASAPRLQAVTEDAMAFAKAMDVDVSRAAQVAGNMLENGMAKNARNAFDILTAASQRVPKELREDVMDAADEYGQFFHTLGINGPEAMGLLAAGASKGMYGIDKAGDAVKEFTIRSTDMSAASKVAYDMLGMSQTDMTRKILAGGKSAKGAFKQIIGGLLSMKDPAKQSQAALALFGTPLEDLNVKDIPKFLRSLQSGRKALGDYRGAAKKAGDTMSDNAQNNLTAFTRKIKMAFIDTLGGKALPVVDDWAAKLSTGVGPALTVVGDVLSKVTDFLKEHHTTALALVGVITALTAVTAAHSAVLAVSAAGGLSQWLLQTKLISGAMKVAAAVQWAWNAAVAANPIVLIVIGLAALAAGLVLAYKKSETFRHVVDSAFKGVKKAASILWSALKTYVGFYIGVFHKVGDAVMAVPGVFHAAFNGVKSAVSKALGWIRSHWGLIVSILGGPAGAAVVLVVKNWNKITAGARAVIGGVRSAFGKVIRFVQSVPGKILHAIGDLGQLLVGAGKAVMDGLKRGIDAGWEKVKGTLKKITDKIPFHKGPEAKDRKLLVKNGRSIMQGLMDGINDGARNLWGLLRKVTDKIGAGKLANVSKAVARTYAAGLAIAKARTRVAAQLEDANQKLTDAISTRDGFESAVTDAVKSFGAVTSIDPVDDAPITGKSVVQGMQDKLAQVKAFAANMKQLLKDGLDQTSYQDMIEKGVDGAGELAAALVQDPAAVKSVADLSQQITDAGKQLGKDSSRTLYQAGVDSAQSLVDGLQVKSDKLTAAAKSIADRLAREVAKALGLAVDKVYKDAAKSGKKAAGKAGNPKAGKGKKGKGGRDVPRYATGARFGANAPMLAVVGDAGEPENVLRDSQLAAVVRAAVKAAGGRDRGPLIGQVVQQPGESAGVLSERLWYLTRTRG